MKLEGGLEPHIARCRDSLGLGGAEEAVLRMLVAVDVDPATAMRAQSEDPWQRQGVLSFGVLFDWLGEIDGIEAAVARLADWGLVQIVGREATDPQVPGVAALRLTHAGRVCLGMAPAQRRGELSELQPWWIFHGAGRESCLTEASLLTGVPAWELLRPEGPALQGQLAEALCCRGGAIVDGEKVPVPVLAQLLGRSAMAAAPRVLLLSQPIELRSIAAAIGAKLRWIPPHLSTRHGGQLLDARVDAALAGSNADRYGVADSEIATPQACNVPLSALLLPPANEARLLQAMVSARYRVTGGYRLLMSGPPGTGKSTTAAVLATLLKKPIVRLDLSSVLSKWLGETEKLIGQIFDVVEDAGAVLALDEAEALMRQRGGEGGSGALSTGVAYLLTRLERFEGVLVATTNRAQDLDEAFFRRFDDYIKLPLPDVPTLRRLWAHYLPAPHTVDIELLSGRFAVSGGLVRGACLRAKSWHEALGGQGPLETPMVLASLGRELEKSNRSSQEVLLEPYRSRVQRLLDGTDFHV